MEFADLGLCNYFTAQTRDQLVPQTNHHARVEFRDLSNNISPCRNAKNSLPEVHMETSEKYNMAVSALSPSQDLYLLEDHDLRTEL